MCDEGYIVICALIFLGAVIGYSVKRNFDENALYIQQGYHQISSTNTVWVK